MDILLMINKQQRNKSLVLTYTMTGIPGHSYIIGSRTLHDPYIEYETTINKIQKKLSDIQQIYSKEIEDIEELDNNDYNFQTKLDMKKDKWNSANEQFRYRIYKWIQTTSETINRCFLPKEDEKQGKPFVDGLKLVDEWSKENNTNPHLLIITDDIRLPWWLARTYDNETYWCCRYALGLLPAGSGDARPTFEVPLRISVLSRPTKDLQMAQPLDIEDFIGSLKDRHNVIGCIEDGSKNRNDFGLEKTEIIDGFAKSQLIVYYGHFASDGGANPLDCSIKAKSPPGTYQPSVSVQLKRLALSERCFFLAGCESAGITEQNVCLADALLQKGSMLIGSLYPVFSSNAPQFIKDFCTNLLDKRTSFGEALRRARKLDISDPQTTFDGAAFCLFGDPSLPSPMLSKAVGKMKSKVRIVYPPFLAQAMKRFGEITSYASEIEISEKRIAELDSLLDLGDPVIAVYPVSLATERLMIQKKDWIILGPVVKTRQDVVILAHSDFKFNKPEDLVGKRLCCKGRGFSAAKMAALYLTMNGIGPDSVEWTFLPKDCIQAIEQGLVEAAIAIRTEDGHENESARVIVELDDWMADELGGAVPRSVLVTSRKPWEQNKLWPILMEIIDRYNERIDILLSSPGDMQTSPGVQISLCHVGDRTDEDDIDTIMKFTRLLEEHNELQGHLERRHFFIQPVEVNEK